MNLREYTFGVAAGVDSDAEFFMSRIPVQTGDIVCLYTDGVYCARKRNGDPFGKSDLADTVRKNSFLGADDLARKILEVLREKEDPSVDGDDRTVQVLKIE
jgi:serine phosphatase RsbU (regulator of sigma subunit)